MSYVTDIDVHEQPAMLLRHHAFISVGHDEYWSATMRAGAEYARDHGVNLAFLGAGRTRSGMYASTRASKDQTV